ncbi:MAG: M10 family metallopeptidase C-terminal domain-containing protein [Allosphingosinicella sp.]|uniref:M10 family metallopeptidase C-terminal domain-containing protein n=1 Tax=Allosphingosinicella sp. TaxID=2823234 RepID=UPI0039462F75
MSTTLVLASARPSETRLSPDGNKLYSADADGFVRVYSVLTGGLIDAWKVGQKLGGMDISPDGTFLVVVERNLTTTYKVDTATGTAKSYLYGTSALEGLFFDVAVLSDGTALFSQDFPGSGWVTLKVLDFATGVYSAGASVRQSSFFTRSPTGETVLIGEPNISSGDINIYRTGEGIVYTNQAAGFNSGIQAFSGSLAAHYIYNEGIHVYGNDLRRIVTLTSWNHGAVADLAFSNDGKWLYILQNVQNYILKVSTDDWAVKAHIPVGVTVGSWWGNSGTYGSRLLVDPMDRYYSVAATNALALVSNPFGTITATPGDDILFGAFANDLFMLQEGGSDEVYGGSGTDGFYFGAALTADDQVDGGPGSDQVGLQGDYSSGVTFVASTMVNVEMLVLLSGSDTRFGDTGGSLYSYKLKTHDGNVAAGERLTVSFNTLLAGENVTFDGSAETDGHFLFYAGLGADDLTGGHQDDGFYFGHARFGANDKVDGQGGSFDQLGLQGNYSGAHAIAFGADQIRNVEMIVLLTGGDVRFGGGGAGYSYDLTMHDGNVLAGQMLTISANTLRSDETLTFDGSAETDGGFRIFSGSGNDTIVGSAGNDELWGGAGDDVITGGLGADLLRGGAGNDRFVYLSTADSTGQSMDQILDFNAGDKIDLGAIDADTGAPGNQSFTFIGAAAFSGKAGELRAWQQDGRWIVEGDVNGNAAADLVIAVTTTGGHILTAADFLG